MPAHQINAGYPTWTPPAPRGPQPAPPYFPGASEHTWPMELLTTRAPFATGVRRPWLHFVTYPIVLAAGVAIGLIPQQDPGGADPVIATGATSATGAGAGAAAHPATFADGTFVVGEDIAPGRYVTSADQGTRGCYWARLTDTSGTMSSILANDNISGRTTVTIQTSDGAFESSGGCTWTRR